MRPALPSRRPLLSSAPFSALLLALAAAALPAAAQIVRVPPTPIDVTACPLGVAPESRCQTGRDPAGAHYWLAVPPDWNGVLVVHAHGGPALNPPQRESAADDLRQWSVWTRAGYAYAGSSYRQAGFEVRAAGEDTARLPALFAAAYGTPRRTVLHGQSWGAHVAARLAESDPRTANGAPLFDAVLLTHGVLGGSPRSYDFRLDLRVVYQAVCGNHPAPQDLPYPVWQGLPPGSRLTPEELARRVDDCTGVRKPPGDRSAAQQRALQTLTRVIGIPERTLIYHLRFATWHFQDLVFKRLGGRNPFSNAGVRYRGSADDDALNQQVARFTADAEALAALAADADLQGRVAMPVMTVHGVDDPVAFVELESTFRDTMARGGSAERLLQLYTQDSDHAYGSDAQYRSALAALLDWVERDERPTPAQVAERCLALEAGATAQPPACRFLPDYQPAPLSTRVPAR